MQIASTGGIDYPGLLKQLTAALKAAPADAAVQEPTGSSLASATSAVARTPPPAARPIGSASHLFDSGTFGGLLSVQDRTAPPADQPSRRLGAYAAAALTRPPKATLNATSTTAGSPVDRA